MTRRRLIGFIAVIQSFLWLTHWLHYETWTFSFSGSDTSRTFWLKLILANFLPTIRTEIFRRDNVLSKD